MKVTVTAGMDPEIQGEIVFLFLLHIQGLSLKPPQPTELDGKVLSGPTEYGTRKSDFRHPPVWGREGETFWTSPTQGKRWTIYGNPHSRGEMDNVLDIPTPGERWEHLGHSQALQIKYR